MRIFGGETNNGLGNQFTFFGIDSDNRFRFDRLQDGTTNTVIEMVVDYKTPQIGIIL